MANSQFFVSGPCYLWVGLGSNQAYLFLGFSEQGLTVELGQQTEDVNVDYAGTMPGTVSLLGESIRVTGTYTRFTDSVMQQILSWKGPNGTAGFGQNNILGSLMYEEGLSYPLLIFSPYSFKNQYNGTMVPGFNIPNAIYGDTSRRTLSIRRTAPEVDFRGLPIFGTQQNNEFQANTAPFNSYLLYNNMMPNPLPGVD